MKSNIVHVGAVGTAGLASGYERTNTTTSGVSAVAETGGNILVGVSIYPFLVPLPLVEPGSEIEPIVVQVQEDELAHAYRAMAAENSRLAEESLPIALEEWPRWETR